MDTKPVRVAVFIDWQNTYKSAREAFGWKDYPNEYGNYSPYRLACLLAEGNGRLKNTDLVCVNIHRGLPSPKHDLQGYAANRRQAAAWMKENPSVVFPRLRSLRYGDDPDEAPREKGVDVELALSAVERVLSAEDNKRCDVAVVFSHDTDLVPLVQMLARLKGTSCIETASWVAEGFYYRIRTDPPVYHHDLAREVFDWVETRVNYGRV